MKRSPCAWKFGAAMLLCSLGQLFIPLAPAGLTRLRSTRFENRSRGRLAPIYQPHEPRPRPRLRPPDTGYSLPRTRLRGQHCLRVETRS